MGLSKQHKLRLGLLGVTVTSCYLTPLGLGLPVLPLGSPLPEGAHTPGPGGTLNGNMRSGLKGKVTCGRDSRQSLLPAAPPGPKLPVVQVNGLALLLAVGFLYFPQPEQFMFKYWP